MEFGWNKFLNEFGDIEHASLFSEFLRLLLDNRDILNNVEFLNVLDEYLNDGGDPNEQDIDGDTPLHYASKAGDLEIIAILISNNANVDLRNFDGVSILHDAARYGNLEAVKFLINYIDIDITDDNGYTPLHYASVRGYPEIVRFLLNNNANVNTENFYGTSPLYDVSEQVPTENNLKIVKLLVNNGANLKFKDNYGNEPIDVASGYVYEYLLNAEKYADNDSFLYPA